MWSVNRYLLVKLFAWFWLTLSITLIALLGVSQLQPDSINVRILKGPMIQHLEYVKAQLEKIPEEQQSRKLKQLLRRENRGQRHKVYLAHRDPTKNIYGHRRLEDLDLAIINFATTDKPLSIYTERFRAFGPIDVQFRREGYRLFIISDKPEPQPIAKLRNMPTWVKVATVLLVSFLLSYWFSKSLLQPIKNLKIAAAKLASGKLDTRARIDEKRKDELGQLGNDFNTMAAQLQHQVEVQKRLLADISHELRSPLTRLQMSAGIAQELTPSLESNSAVANHLERITKEAEQVEFMLNELLQLSRLESDQVHLEKRVLAYNDLFNPIIDDLMFEASQMNKKVIYEAPQSTHLFGDAMLLNQVFENIFRNALKYANNEVNIHFKVSDTHLVCVVQDDGCGVQDDILDKLSIPFFRASSARTPEQLKGGFGLGLAIAQHAIKVHHGSIKFENNQGLRVSITLPLHD